MFGETKLHDLTSKRVKKRVKIYVVQLLSHHQIQNKKNDFKHISRYALEFALNMLKPAQPKKMSKDSEWTC